MFLLRIKQMLTVSKDPACLECMYVNVLLSTREKMCILRHLQVVLKSRPQALVVFTALSCSFSAPSRRSIVFHSRKKKIEKVNMVAPVIINLVSAALSSCKLEPTCFVRVSTERDSRSE